MPGGAACEPALLKLECVREALAGLVHGRIPEPRTREILTEQVWSEAQEFLFLTSTQMACQPHGPHGEQPRSRISACSLVRNLEASVSSTRLSVGSANVRRDTS